MTILEMRDARNKLLKDAQAILLAGPDAEKRAQATKMLVDADTFESDAASLEKIEKLQGEERSRTTPPRGTPDGGISSDNKLEAEARSKKAFDQFIRYGSVDAELRSSLQEHRDVTTATAGTLIPQAYLPILTQAQKFYGNILNKITIVPADNGAPTKYGVIDDIANGMVVLGEDTAASETDPSFLGSTISSDFMSTGVVQVSLATMQDSAWDVETFLRDSMGKRYFRGLSQFVTNGNAANIGSIIPTLTLSAVTSAAPATIAWADVAAVFAALDPAYETGASWSMSTSTRGTLLGITDSLGRPLYIPAPSAETFDMVLGKPVNVNPYMATVAATHTSLMYGDHSQYVLRVVKPGLTVVRLNERYMDKGNVGFIGFARAGGALLSPIATTPLVKLVQHA